MNGLLRNSRTWFAGLLGAAVLAGSPLSAQADQGKWWDPQQGGNDRQRVEENNTRYAHGGPKGDRGLHRGWRGGAPAFLRDVVVIREGYRGPRYRAHRVWVTPTYFERQHLIAIRPVRYYVQVGATIGGVRIDARFHDHGDYYYGCNFCDARFDDYDGYRHHVVRCDYRPRGYRFDVCDWDSEWNDRACEFDSHDERGYDRDWD